MGSQPLTGYQSQYASLVAFYIIVCSPVVIVILILTFINKIGFTCKLAIFGHHIPCPIIMYHIQREILYAAKLVMIMRPRELGSCELSTCLCFAQVNDNEKYCGRMIQNVQVKLTSCLV